MRNWSVVIAILFFSFQIPKSLYKKVNKEITKVFNVETFQLESIVLETAKTKNLLAKFSEDNFFEIKSTGQIIGYAYLGKAPSKTDEFDYLILFDTDQVIKKTKILVYREDYGGEIGSKRWLRQFIGKNQEDQLTYGDDIVAISGATISGKSMTKVVNNVLHSLSELQREGVFNED